MVHLEGIEPPASPLGGERSILLSYKCILRTFWSTYYAFNFSNISSTSIPCTSHASSIVSSWATMHPKQCIPASKSISAFSGFSSSNCPIFVLLFPLLLMLILFFLLHIVSFLYYILVL